nr:DUF4336 domain-containing protein [Lentibacter algarum]
MNTLKPLADDIWLIDAPHVKFYGLPFSTRCVVVRLASGGLWVHSPTMLTEELKAELAALGPVEHLIAPNWIHYVSVKDWQAAYPEAVAWAAPGVVARAASRNVEIAFDHDLGAEAEAVWAGEIGQLIVTGSKVHSEAVFFHQSSCTLILTDLIENFEASKMPLWLGPLMWLGGVLAPNGGMPRDMRASFGKHKDVLRGHIMTMLTWAPERVIVSHGAWFEHDGAAELRRAFDWLGLSEEGS